MLFENGHPPISAVEAGPWFSLDQIRAAKERIPDCAFHFHASNMLTSSLRLGQAIARMEAYHEVTDSPWVTPHIDLMPPGYFRFYRRFHVALPMPGEKRMIKRFITRVRRLTDAIALPVVLENMPTLPVKGYEFQADPQVIAYILEETGCRMLLDSGHAHIGAYLRGMDVSDYLQRLPLEKVVHLHASGPRERGGLLVDAHEPLQEVDYQILEWILARCPAQVLTLEYFKEPAALQDQLELLAKML